MRRVVLSMLALAFAAPAIAAEPSGCDKFKWPIDRERTALTAADRQAVTTGAELTHQPPLAMMLSLKPTAEAALPSAPEREPAASTFAGFIRLASPGAAGRYSISLSAGAWVDVVQDGKSLKPAAFSGATDCDGIRKTMKFDLAAAPLVIQLSGVRANTVSLAVLKAN